MISVGMNATFTIIMALSLVLTFISKRGHKNPTAKDFFVASGQFGPVLFFFLSVGETYSIASLLGFPGGVYAHGDSFVTWFFGYILMAAPIIYFVGPWIWRAGSLYGSVTIADFFRSHFDSRRLELVVALTSLLLLIPVGATQFLGLKLVLAGLGLHAPAVVLSALAGVMAFSYVAIAGLRASAYVAALKDLLMIGSILLVGGMAIVMWHGAPLAGALAPLKVVAHPVPNEQVFAITTIILQGLGFAMVPQTWAFIFSARSVQTIRRAQIAAPLYMVMFPLLMIVAYFARAQGLKPSVPDDVFLATAQALLPPWLVGVAMAAATLSGLVVLSGVCLAIGPLVTRNLLSGLEGPAQERWAKRVIAAYIVLAIMGAEGPVRLMATLNNVFYFGIAQMLPGLLAALCVGRVSAGAVIGGIVAGDALALALTASGTSVVGINAGLLGLVLNLLVMFCICAWRPRAGAVSVMGKFLGDGQGAR
jgi:SSS family solute:Na+ symporter